jgi:lysophospholipase L1-like esterase
MSDRTATQERLKSRPAIAVGVVVLLLILVLIVDAATSRSGDTVVVLGDSITALGTNQLNSSLGSDYHLTINGHFGARVSDQENDAAFLAALHAKQVIINLGTNDVLNGVPTGQTTLELQQMVQKFQGADCIHLVTVNVNIRKGAQTMKPQAEALNTEINKLASANSNVNVIDWNSIDAPTVDATHPNGLTIDGVHPTADGQKQLVDAYSTALDRCGRPWKIW